MSEIRQLLQDVYYEANRLEVLGDALAAEARQTRNSANDIERELGQAATEDIDLDRLASLRQIHNELIDGVHREVQYQLDTLRDLNRLIS